jgi:hypothetical protein
MIQTLPQHVLLKTAAMSYLLRHPQPIKPTLPVRVPVDPSKACPNERQAKKAGFVVISEPYRLPAQQEMLERAAAHLEKGGIEWALVKKEDGYCLARK